MKPEILPLPSSAISSETLPVKPNNNRYRILMIVVVVFFLILGAFGVFIFRHAKADVMVRDETLRQNGSGYYSSSQTAKTVTGVTAKTASKTAISLTALPLGDQKYTTTPQKGYVFLCRVQSGGAGGAYRTGVWINEAAKTWDMTKKLFVTGSVSWPDSTRTVAATGTNRILTSNDLPSHTTGIYPINSTDPAYQYDQNPNSIKSQTLSISIPLDPIQLALPDCVGGEVGIMLSGVPLFNAFDAGGRDAMAWEVQDDCAGHPQVSGLYHYHGLSPCLKDTVGLTEHSALMGYAFDGYGIYGPKGENGVEVATVDLDECHGHTHVITWNGKQVTMYHYHMTHDFPYSVGCFRAKKTVEGPLGAGGSLPQQQPSGRPPLPSGQQPPYPPPNSRLGSPR